MAPRYPDRLGDAGDGDRHPGDAAADLVDGAGRSGRRRRGTPSPRWPAMPPGRPRWLAPPVAASAVATSSARAALAAQAINCQGGGNVAVDVSGFGAAARGVPGQVVTVSVVCDVVDRRPRPTRRPGNPDPVRAGGQSHRPQPVGVHHEPTLTERLRCPAMRGGGPPPAPTASRRPAGGIEGRSGCGWRPPSWPSLPSRV